MTCPSITELCAADAPAVFGQHLASCARCRALIARIETSEAELGEESVAAPGAPATTLEPGGIWTIWAPTADQYLVGAVLDAGEDDLLILPLLSWATWASEADVELGSEVLGYAATASIWLSDRVLTEQAVEAVDMLSEEWLATLGNAYDAFFASEEIEAETGAPIISEEDPRVGAQAAAAERLRPWFSPWAMLQGAEELGPVMGQRRDELEIEPERWSEELGVEPRIWCAFEAGNADPYEAVPVGAMARAVRELGFLASRRLISLARASVLAHNESHGPDQAPAMARRRRGSTRRPNRDGEAVRAAADRYAVALAKELGL